MRLFCRSCHSITKRGFYSPVRSINDSRYVGMSIYNVVVLCLITAPVSLVISSQADASFAFVTAALAFCCFISMALIFLPKVKSGCQLFNPLARM